MEHRLDIGALEAGLIGLPKSEAENSKT